MKKFWHIALVFLYLLHSGGVFGKIHFCADQIQSVAVYHQDLKSCCPEDESSCSSDKGQTYISSACCKTTVFKYHQEDSYTSSEILTFNTFNVTHIPFIFTYPAQLENTETITIPDVPDTQAGLPRYISSCQLLFYH